MALRRFRGATTNSTVVYTGQAFSRELLDTGSANSTNGSTVVLAAGASASFYLTTATGIPNLTTAVTGSWEASIQFQTVTPTNIFCKFRVHRISVSGTVPTILASTEYSAEVQARATQTPYIISTDGTDLGTFSSGHRIAIEWTLRNAGAASLSPQPSFGTYSRFVRTPIESSAVVGWTGFVGQAAYRSISYSEGTIKGVKRTGSVRNTITSTGTAIGTKNGSDFSGSVTGVSTSTGTATGAAGFAGSATGTSTSSGTIAAGTQGYSGAVTGASTSSGTIAAGVQGYAGAVAGSSASSGTIASGVQGYTGSATGSSTSTGSANGTPGPGPGPEPEPSDSGSMWRVWNQDADKKRVEVLALAGRTVLGTSYSFGSATGIAAFNPVEFAGRSVGVSVEKGSSGGQLGYYGGVMQVRMLVRHRTRGKARHDLRGNRELLLLIGEL